MQIEVRPSDLKYRYPKDIEHRFNPKFSGKPDPSPFNRDDLYDIVPMMTAVMNELQSDDGEVLHLLEDILNIDLPRCINRREEVFDCLVETARERLNLP